MPPWRYSNKPTPATHRGSRGRVKAAELQAAQLKLREQKAKDIHEAAASSANTDGTVEQCPPASASDGAQGSCATEVAQPPDSATHVAAGNDDALMSVRPIDQNRTMKYVEVFGNFPQPTSDSEEEWSV